jgi:hypothetical protein
MKKLPKINAAQVLKASLPYVINGLMCTKLGEAYRLTTGTDILDKVLELAAGKAGDDMTVLVAGIWKMCYSR